MSKYTLFIDNKCKVLCKTQTVRKAADVAAQIAEEMYRLSLESAEIRLPQRQLSEGPAITRIRNDMFLRAAFNIAFRVECVLKCSWDTHLVVRVKWYRKGEKLSFRSCYFNVCIADGSVAVTVHV